MESILLLYNKEKNKYAEFTLPFLYCTIQIQNFLKLWIKYWAGIQGGRQWTYQTCTEFGWYQSSDTPSRTWGNIIPVRYLSLDTPSRTWGYIIPVRYLSLDTPSRFWGKIIPVRYLSSDTVALTSLYLYWTIHYLVILPAERCHWRHFNSCSFSRFFEAMCTDIFGPRFNEALLKRVVQDTNTYYGSTDIQVCSIVCGV